MSYVLSEKSTANLRDVHPDLIRVVTSAITLTAQDFRVNDGMRTVAEQKRNVALGVSKTMQSKHLPQADGLSHAVDLVPIVNGQPDFKDWEPIYIVADAMRFASLKLGIHVVWGGCWDRVLTTDTRAAKIMAEDYCERRKKAGLRVFLDGPHFELA